ncbi:hypothetical protein [Butyrivibrio sp. XPD2006]|uniref:hypothetical protein n=1 Tax=Butyrivibrio sp. XPD2006 TaxID=1280668 RepID=UPI0003B7B3DD|nr:hypothetical protein [Butyrivibrio sp. XPD2006]
MDKSEQKIIKNQNRKKFISQTALLVVVTAVFLTVLCGGLFAVFKTYTISFDLGDGSEVLTQTYGIGSGEISLGIPERKGFRFTGWTGSNGKDPKVNVKVGAGQLGDLSYKAHWSDKLDVICEDWLVDKDGNLISNITSDVDKFLKAGNSAKDYKVVDRTMQVKYGSKINPSKWGNDKGYKAYSDKYIYIGNSGDTKVSENGTRVFRYFYPVLDVNYLLDGGSCKDAGVNDADVALFDLYVDGEVVKERISDYCSSVPCGSTYQIKPCWVGVEYLSMDDEDITGTMGTDRINVDLSFATRPGDVSVTCQDWIVDKNGVRLMEITDVVDRYLEAGNSNGKHSAVPRSINASPGDVIDGSLWGDDPLPGAYHNNYCYVGSSRKITVGSRNETVYRYFYPVLDIGSLVDGAKKNNTSKVAKFTVFVDGNPVAENVTDYYDGIPCGSSYKVEITEYLNYDIKHISSAYDEGEMGNYAKSLTLRFETRAGDNYLILEDWLVDDDNNRIRNISEEIDSYLKDKKSTAEYRLQNRTIKAAAGETIDCSLFGNDENIGAFSDEYIYVGSSGEVTAGAGESRIYRYFHLCP